MLSLPVRFEVKAILVPSGDQAGALPPPSVGSNAWPEPSGFMVYNCQVPFCLDPNTIFLPSGDQLVPYSWASLFVRRFSPVPSAPTTNTSAVVDSCPSCEMNESVLPSGDQP